MVLKLENEYSQFVTDHYCKLTSHVCLKLPENKIYLKIYIKRTQLSVLIQVNNSKI